MRRSLAAILFVFGLFAQTAHGGETFPGPAEIRGAIARSLPVIEKASVAWIEKRDCMSCHHVTFMVWSHNEAAAHGVAVDAGKLAEWNAWSMRKSLEQRRFFELSEKSAEALPEAIRPKLMDLVGVSFTHEEEFLAALGKSLPPDEFDRHKGVLVKQSSLAKKGTVNDGGGLDTMTQLLLGRGPNGKDSLNQAFLASTADLIVRWQEANGAWKAAGQLPARRWSQPTADQTTTMWTLLALATLEQPSVQVKKSIEKGLAAVNQAKPDKNHEWLVARTLFEHKFGAPEQAVSLQKELLDRQNSDGGWSSMPGEKSEPFSTGQSLYALRSAGMSENELAVRRGQKYLLDTQNADGSWSTPPAALSSGKTSERLKKLEPIYSHWGNTWAAIGLALSLPEK